MPNIDPGNEPWNPLLKGYKEYFGACRMEFLQRQYLSREFAWSIPTEEALSVIAALASKQAGVIEIGAGTGYWARMLRDRGVNIIAYDIHPVPSIDNTPHHLTPSFTEVLQDDHQVIINYPDRILLMCWASPTGNVASETLKLYKGDLLVYVGQRDGVDGATGDEQFYKMLTDDWQLDRTVQLPRWQGRQDDLRAYSRRPIS